MMFFNSNPCAKILKISPSALGPILKTFKFFNSDLLYFFLIELSNKFVLPPASDLPISKILFNVFFLG